MDVGDVISVAVAFIAAAAAYASQRAAARASTLNTQTTSRVDMEKDAYERARKFDTETIQRQDVEILELRQDNRNLHEKIGVAQSEAREACREARECQVETQSLRERLAVYENVGLQS